MAGRAAPGPALGATACPVCRARVEVRATAAGRAKAHCNGALVETACGSVVTWGPRHSRELLASAPAPDRPGPSSDPPGAAGRRGLVRFGA